MVFILLFMITLVHSILCFPFVTSRNTKNCSISNEFMHIDQDLDLEQGRNPDLTKRSDFGKFISCYLSIYSSFLSLSLLKGYIYTLNSSTISLSADIDLGSKLVTQEILSSSAVAILSHISYSETNSTLLLQGWISPMNRFRIQQLDNIVHLELRTYSYDEKNHQWFSKFFSDTRITGRIQRTNTDQTQQDSSQQLVLELTPYDAPNEHLQIVSSASGDGQWIDWNSSCNFSPQKRSDQSIQEIIDSAILL